MPPALTARLDGELSLSQKSGNGTKRKGLNLNCQCVACGDVTLHTNCGRHWQVQFSLKRPSVGFNVGAREQAESTDFEGDIVTHKSG